MVDHDFVQNVFFQGARGCGSALFLKRLAHV